MFPHVIAVWDDCETEIFIQLLHILTKALQSPATISFGVPGNQPAKMCPKVN